MTLALLALVAACGDDQTSDRFNQVWLRIYCVQALQQKADCADHEDEVVRTLERRKPPADAAELVEWKQHLASMKAQAANVRAGKACGTPFINPTTLCVGRAGELRGFPGSLVAVVGASDNELLVEAAGRLLAFQETTAADVASLRARIAAIDTSAPRLTLPGEWAVVATRPTPEGRAAYVLRRLDLDPDEIQEEWERVLRGEKAPPPKVEPKVKGGPSPTKTPMNADRAAAAKRPRDKKPVAKKAPAPLTVDRIELVGFVGDYPSPKAFIRVLPSRRTMTVTQGQEVAGWTVTVIAPDVERLVVTDPDGNRHSLRKP